MAAAVGALAISELAHADRYEATILVRPVGALGRVAEPVGGGPEASDASPASPPEVTDSVRGAVPWTAAADATVVFLAGSIEMGSASDWQAALTAVLAARAGHVVVFNPRRDARDASWRQAIDEPRFREQVE